MGGRAGLVEGRPRGARRFTWRLAVALIMAAVASSARAEAPKRILFIASYDPAFPTFPQQMSGLREVLDPAGHYLDVEIMDSKEFPSQENLLRFRRLLDYKLQQVRPYDLVIAGDDNATRFAVEEQEGLLDGAPVVFFGVNDRALAERLGASPKVTGVVEAVSVRRTLEVMARLHPEARRVFAIADSTVSGSADLETYRALGDRFGGLELEVLSLSDLRFAQLSARLEALGPDSLVLLLSAYRDVDGRRMRFFESLRFIVDHLDRPLYHLYFHGLGRGVIGGKVVSHRRQASAAASMALQILEGRRPGSIPVQTESPNELVFDYPQLERFGVSLDALPAPVAVLNRPFSVYEAYAPWIWTVAVTMSLLVALTLLLGFNIVRRQRAERDLRARERELQKVLDASPIGVALLEGGRIAYVNDHFVRTFGYALEAVPTLERWWELAVPDAGRRRIASALSASAIRSARRAGGPVPIQEGEVRCADGSSRIVRATTVAVDEHDLVLLDDVTERRLAEARRIDQQKMEAIGTLAGGIAHDFNNILTPILGFVELSQMDVEPDSDMAFDLAQIHTAATRAKGLVQQILAFSRRSSGNRERAAASSIVEEAMVLIRASLPASIEIETDLRTVAVVEVDVTRMHQVVMNLCTNAGRAMGHDGGKLTVTLSDCNSSASACGVPPDLQGRDLVCLCVADTGCGIPEGDLARVFEPFFTTRPRGEGTGMGLAVVHGVVRDHGGRVVVDSTVGEGSNFRIWLPVAGPERAPVTPPSGSAEAVRPARVLFVDDEAPLRALVERALPRARIEVTCAPDGAAALEHLTDAPTSFDALITDVTMPVMGGDTLVERLREMQLGLPVIMCTGRLETLSTEWLERFRPDRVLEKPVVASDLVRVLNEILGA